VVRDVLRQRGVRHTEASAEDRTAGGAAAHSRGVEVDDEYRVGEDVAVPRSRLVDYVAVLEPWQPTTACTSK
jgi:glycolate oxidase